MTSIQNKLKQDIESDGWHVLKILEGDETEPAFAYTVGLTHSYGHPELVVLGLDLDLMHWMLNDIGDRVQGGLAFTAGQVVDELLEGTVCRLGTVSQDWNEPLFGQALAFYGDRPFEVLQVLWPDAAGAFPDEPQYSKGLVARQPVLARAARSN